MLLPEANRRSRPHRSCFPDLAASHPGHLAVASRAPVGQATTLPYLTNPTGTTSAREATLWRDRGTV
jgi:hypothetical protein